MPASNKIATVTVKGPNGEVVINEADFTANPRLYEPVDDRSKQLAKQFTGQKDVPPVGTSQPLPSLGTVDPSLTKDATKPSLGAVDPSLTKDATKPTMQVSTPTPNPAQPPVPPPVK